MFAACTLCSFVFVFSSSHSHSHYILRFILIYTWHSTALLPLLRCAYQNATMKWYTFGQFFDRKLDKISRNTKFHFILFQSRTREKNGIRDSSSNNTRMRCMITGRPMGSSDFAFRHFFEWEHSTVRTHLLFAIANARACVVSNRPTRTIWIARKQKSLLFSVLLALAFTASFAHSHTHTHTTTTQTCRSRSLWTLHLEQ